MIDHMCDPIKGDNIARRNPPKNSLITCGTLKLFKGIDCYSLQLTVMAGALAGTF